MDADRFDGLVEEHHGEIHRYLRRVCGRGPDADDLSQETFLRAFRAAAELPGGANVRAWLFAIATNLARNHFRSEGRRKKAWTAAAIGEADGQRPGPAEEAFLADARGLVESAVARLPLRQRLAFSLRKFHGLEYEVIGKMLDCSIDTARAHVFQAFRKLRTALNHSEDATAEARR